MITAEQFWKGRDVEYAKELTPQIKANAEETIGRVNELLALAGRSDDAVASGWRPAAVNDHTANAASHSKHLTGEAVDVADPDRTLATWIADNLEALEQCKLWAEDFRWTPHWVHLQIVAPKSEKRIYIPSVAKALDPSFPVTWA